MKFDEVSPSVGALYEEHFSELLRDISPEAVNDAYRAALARKDREGALAALADYYRGRDVFMLPDFSEGPYRKAVADRAVRGEMRVVNIDWTFPDGKVDFLFNPTLATPPVNHEWLWQFNRHPYWKEMARAYADTKDEIYAVAFERQLLDWIAQAQCPAEDWNGAGSAWRTIECGLRLLGSWQAAFHLFRRSPSVSDGALLLMIASMHRQAKHLLAHPTRGNWLMMECNGVYTFTSLFPEFSDAEAARRLSCDRLVAELYQQILPDGFQNELSPDYHGVAFSCAVDVFRIADSLGRTGELPDAYREIVHRMANAALAVSTPGLTQPRTNDTFTIPTVEFTRSIRALFPDDETLAFFDTGRREGKAPAGETASRFLPNAGFAAMRSDWSGEANYLLFDVGPLGAAHLHQDKLNINLYRGAEELIFDDGGGQYEISRERTYACSSFDHNTVIVDGLEQKRKEPKVLDAPVDAGFITNAVFDYAFGVYDGVYGAEAVSPAVHRREVRFCRPDFYCVRDTLTSNDGAPHDYEARFHLDTLHMESVSVASGALRSRFGKTSDVVIVPLATPGEAAETVQTVSGQMEPEILGMYIGRNEAKNHPCTTVLLRSRDVNHHFTTLLFPIAADEELPTVERLPDGNVRVIFRGRTVLLNPACLNA